MIPLDNGVNMQYNGEISKFVEVLSDDYVGGAACTRLLDTGAQLASTRDNDVSGPTVWSTPRSLSVFLVWVASHMHDIPFASARYRITAT
jgi:hypothetical protein